MAERFTTPVGRFVQGDAFKMQETDQKGNLRVFKSGPKIGQPNPVSFVRIAIPKTPGCQAWWQEPDPFFQTVLRVGQTEFPGGQSAKPDFSWKIIDGDSTVPNSTGKVPAQQEGFAGCWVVSFQSGYQPKCFARPDYAAHQQITDPSRIKRGHYITVNGSCSGNEQMVSNYGVYLNLDLISWEGFGPEILSGPDAAAAFAQAPALPAGASMVPLATATPGAPAPSAAPPLPTPAAAMHPATGASPSSPTPAPYGGFMQPPSGAPASPAASPPPPSSAPPAMPSPGKQMLPAANGFTYEQMKLAGWTDEALVQQGMMAA